MKGLNWKLHTAVPFLPYDIRKEKKKPTYQLEWQSHYDSQYIWP